jgi:hypothetical protein
MNVAVRFRQRHNRIVRQDFDCATSVLFVVCAVVFCEVAWRRLGTYREANSKLVTRKAVLCYTARPVNVFLKTFKAVPPSHRLNWQRSLIEAQ